MQRISLTLDLDNKIFTSVNPLVFLFIAAYNDFGDIDESNK